MKIELSNVCYTYKSKYHATHAVKDVSCSFESSHIYAITGTSGSGKTTLLSMIAGLKVPTSGEISIDGKSVLEMDRCKLRREEISVIYQDFNLFPLLTVEENAAYPLLVRKEAKQKAEQAAREKLLQVGLKEDQFKRLPNMLSGGEQQRVAIARALASNNKIILADEPTGNLDRENSRNIVEILKKLAHEENCCVIIVTHDPAAAEEADTVLPMRDGKLEVWCCPKNNRSRQ